MTFNIKTLGCKVNSYESEIIYSLFIKKGYLYSEENADIYIVNTCTVTNMSDRKSRQMIHKIRKEHPNSILIVCGCFVENKRLNDSLNLIDADIIIGNLNKGKIVEYLEDYLENKKRKEEFNDLNTRVFEEGVIESVHNKTRAFVKIEDGCDNFCTYCIIPYVRGRVRSKKKESILKEVNKLVSNGYKEIVLTGIHTGAYNDNGYDFALLLEDLIKIPNLYRIRISSIEVNELNERVINIIEKSDKIVPHLHIPLQSGSDEILKKMNRKYNKEFFLNKIEHLRKVKKDLSITTDVIVGFPTETDELFNESIEFIKKVHFTKVHVFPYSDRYNTPASKMEGKIDDLTKKKRVKELIEISNTLEMDFYKKYYNKELEVLFEEEKDGYIYGHTANYIKVKTKENYKQNEIHKIKLTKDNICL